jgi:hypothetical protein
MEWRTTWTPVPAEAGVAITGGCPDKDGDGIADKDDQCPNQAGLVSYHGCPAPDTDKDGITDDKDKCPTLRESPVTMVALCLTPTMMG